MSSAIRKIRMGVDPLGGAGVHYWPRIAEQYRLDLTVVNEAVDPTFRFMTLDWDGKIRMDPSSSYAMQRLIDLKDRYDIAFACDTDHDRHGIVTASSGLMPPNHYLAVAIDYLFRHRSGWRGDAAVGKTVVSSAMIDRVGSRLQAHGVRSAGRIQVVRRWAGRRKIGVWRRGKRRRFIQPHRWQRLDHRQGWHRPGAAVGGDHGAHRAGSGRALPRLDAGAGRLVCRPHRRAGDTRRKRQSWANSIGNKS